MYRECFLIRKQLRSPLLLELKTLENYLYLNRNIKFYSTLFTVGHCLGAAYVCGRMCSGSPSECRLHFRIDVRNSLSFVLDLSIETYYALLRYDTRPNFWNNKWGKKSHHSVVMNGSIEANLRAIIPRRSGWVVIYMSERRSLGHMFTSRGQHWYIVSPGSAVGGQKVILISPCRHTEWKYIPFVCSVSGTVHLSPGKNAVDVLEIKSSLRDTWSLIPLQEPSALTTV